MLGWAVCFPIMVVALAAVLQPIFGCLQRRYFWVFQLNLISLQS